MKKLMFLSGFLLASFLSFGQSFEKGNLVGLHVVSFDYQPGVTEEQLIKYMQEVYIPASEKAYGDKTFTLKGIRGEYAGKLATLSIFENEAARDKFYRPDESLTAEGQVAENSIKSVMDGFSKYITNITTIYNDYLILNGTAIPLLRGSLIGLHITVPVMNSGVTLEQYFDEYINKAIPAYDTYMGMHGNLSKVIRGKNPNAIGYFAIFPDEKTRDQFFIGNEAEEKLKTANSHIRPVVDPLEEKYGKWPTVFTDWVVL